jgi:hypothetical protein
MLAAAVAPAQGHAIAIAGDAAARALVALAGRLGARVIEAVPPPAAGVLLAALRRWRCGDRGDSVRPLYLRPPDVTWAARQRPPGAL